MNASVIKLRLNIARNINSFDQYDICMSLFLETLCHVFMEKGYRRPECCSSKQSTEVFTLDTLLFVYVENGT